MSTQPITQDPDEVIENPGALVNNYRLVESLRSALSSGQHAFDLVPDVIEEIIEEKAWQDRLDRGGQRQKYNRDDEFEDFIADPPPRGLGTTKNEIRKYLGASDNPLRVLFEKAAEKGPGNPVAETQPHDSNGKFHRIPNSIRNTVGSDMPPPVIPFRDSPSPPAPKRDRSAEPQAGTSVGYAVRRLGRERPDLLAKVEMGECTAHNAMVMAGFLPRTITIPIEVTAASRLILKHFSDDDVLELIRILANHAGFDLTPRE
jgi:hypothetical protein